MHILAIDDDPLVLMSTVAMIEDLGHTVIDAASGRLALEALARDPAIELVITDQAMPNMSGMQLAKAIGELRPALPIVLATGYAEVAEEQSPLPRLSKPFGQPDLQKIIAAASRAF